MAGRIDRGDIWMVDLGFAAKIRPCVILSVPFLDHEKAVVTYVARSTKRRGGRFEVEHNAPNFLPGVFDTQNIGTVPTSKLVRRLARISPEKMIQLEASVKAWLGMV